MSKKSSLRAFLAGFSFQDDSVTPMEVNIQDLLAKFNQLVEDFAKDEDVLRHYLDMPSEDLLQRRAQDEYVKEHGLAMKRWSFSAGSGGNWFWELKKVVPPLVLELLKHTPKNGKALEKVLTFHTKKWSWKPDFISDQTKQFADKYFPTLKTLRANLQACQDAVASIGSNEAVAIKVGKFELYDGLGVDEKVVGEVKASLVAATKAMSRIGLGAYCYGKVTIVNPQALKSGTAAFYAQATDELYVGIHAGHENVRVVCHELAHRVLVKLNLKSRAQELYAVIKSRNTWVTNYAKTDPVENFAEMVSFAALGKLPEDSTEALKLALPKAKLASLRSYIAEYKAVEALLRKRGGNLR